MNIAFSRETRLLKNVPTRDASPPLEVALSGSVGCLRLSQNGIIKQHKTQALMGATRLEAAEKCPDAGQGKLL